MNLKLKLAGRGALLMSLAAINSQLSTASAQGTAFTYQGRLNDSGSPANGTYDLRFAVFDAASAGNQAGGTRTNVGTGVTNGIFTVTLDFGPIFTGSNYWLDIGVRTNGGGTFTGLTPRQPLLPVPYAMFAATASNVSGVIANGSLPPSPSFSGTVTAGGFSGSGAGLTSLNASSISGGTLGDGFLSPNVALLNRNGQTFTGSQAFTGGLSVNSSAGFDQSSLGGFFIDAPFIVGGRLTVLTNGNVGVGTNNPSQKLHVIGNALLTGALDLPATATVNAGPNRVLFSDANQNFFAGQSAGKVSSGSNNSGLGYEALFSDTTGSFNTAVGDLGLGANTTGTFNTATGFFALGSATTGTLNTAEGAEALGSLVTGSQNTAVGEVSLFSSTNNNNNTAVGYAALFANAADNNTAVGSEALDDNTTGTGNVAVGDSALLANGVGNGNTAIGHQALQNFTGFGPSTAIGSDALQLDTTGIDNVAVGAGSLSSITTGTGNIGIGNGAGLSLSGNSSENIDIGSTGVAGDQNTIRIGNGTHQSTFIAGIFGSTAASGVNVFVDSNGHLGTLTSSAKYKQNIRSMGDKSDELLALRPVSFQYKPEYDPQGLPQFGLIAEEVEKVDPALVAHDANNNIYTVRYQAVDAMLLNEFLKQHHRIVARDGDLQALQEENESLQKRLDRLEQMMKSNGENR